MKLQEILKRKNLNPKIEVPNKISKKQYLYELTPSPEMANLTCSPSPIESPVIKGIPLYRDFPPNPPLSRVENSTIAKKFDFWKIY